MRFLWVFVAAGTVYADVAMAAQPDMLRQQLRLLNAQQTLELQQRQDDFRARLGDLSPERAALLKRSLDLQRIDQRQLQQRQLRRQHASRQQLRVVPQPGGAARLSQQLQGFKRQQQQQQLNHSIQRRSWSRLRR
jgi:hypothetical protein